MINPFHLNESEPASGEKRSDCGWRMKKLKLKADWYLADAFIQHITWLDLVWESMGQPIVRRWCYRSYKHTHFELKLLHWPDNKKKTQLELLQRVHAFPELWFWLASQHGLLVQYPPPHPPSFPAHPTYRVLIMGHVARKLLFRLFHTRGKCLPCKATHNTVVLIGKWVSYCMASFVLFITVHVNFWCVPCLDESI